MRATRGVIVSHRIVRINDPETGRRLVNIQQTGVRLGEDGQIVLDYIINLKHCNTLLNTKSIG